MMSLQIVDMPSRAKRQFNRIDRSVSRLTPRTGFEKVRITRREPAGDERVAFAIYTADGQSLFECYCGVLLAALEHWIDDSLDQRFYAASKRSIRHLLKAPRAWPRRSVGPH
jgi:hypothetical protein